MSNKIVPSVYRSVIDDVIANIKSEFDEYGVSEDVLAELQHKWETKVIQSHVADFEPQPPLPQQTAPPPPQHPSIPHPSYPPHPMHMNPHYPHTSYNIPPPPPPHVPVHTAVQVKQEPMDNRYVLSGPPQHQHPPHPYTLPPLAGPQVNKPPNSAVPAYPPVTGQARPPSTGPAPPAPTARYPNGHPQQPPATQQPQASASPAPTARIPQVDGPSSSSSESPSPPASYAPRAMHPSLPQPSGSGSANGNGYVDDEETINSDLDDSDSDNEGDAAGVGTGADTDIVFCTYDKVARVKNKWKCVLKDGMIHVNGKDYLFAKCTGEFEW